MGTGSGKKRPSPASKSPPSSPSKKSKASDSDFGLIGPPFPPQEAKSKWPHRYQSQSKTASVSVTLPDGSTEEKELFQAKRHYSKAITDGIEYNLYDDAYIKASDGEPDFITKIVEIFETSSKEAYICTQRYYRAKDTVIKDQDQLIDTRRVFYSDVKDDNPLDCITSKVNIKWISVNMDVAAQETAKGSCDVYVDMRYSFPHAFTCINTDNDNSSTTDVMIPNKASNVVKPQEFQQRKYALLDLYSGCGAMSSGLSIGALLGGENIITVRNEDAEDFFVLLKEWQKLCKEFKLEASKDSEFVEDNIDSDESEIDDGLVPSGEFEVEKLVAICFGDPNKVKNPGLHFKVRWKGYGRADDTWEPVDGLSKCKDKIREFVLRGHKARILPLPGDVDFICGGPPCQGISGFNRFREACDPLKDKKNHQLVVFMNIVEFLKPRYVLMENVSDILKFAKGQLASYAVARLVSMNFQARLGIMAAGAYGVPQCRMRFFLWGAGPMESLPQFPLPTHEVLKKGVVINEFKELIVGGEELNGLHKPVLIGDTISDLPEVTNDAKQDEMQYGSTPHTSFQKFIRLKRLDSKKNDTNKSILYDHRPLQMSQDDYERVCQIPKFKGANFRNLPGLIVGPDNTIQLDPSVERPLCKSGKPLVPDYAISFVNGKSSKPFGRLGMDDIVATVVTRGQPHNQAILHLNQDRVLTARENARLQGFPDCYKLHGTMKERYKQVGNAVAFSVSIPLWYWLAKAMQMHGANSNPAPLCIPFKFPDCLGQLKSLREELQES